MPLPNPSPLSSFLQKKKKKQPLAIQKLKEWKWARGNEEGNEEGHSWKGQQHEQRLAVKNQLGWQGWRVSHSQDQVRGQWGRHCYSLRKGVVVSTHWKLT